jgi:hypothetical protein
VFVDSFSKVLSPAIRLGYLVAGSAAALRLLRSRKIDVDLSTPYPGQVGRVGPRQLHPTLSWPVVTGGVRLWVLPFPAGGGGGGVLEPGGRGPALGHPHLTPPKPPPTRPQGPAHKPPHITPPTEPPTNPARGVSVPVMQVLAPLLGLEPSCCPYEYQAPRGGIFLALKLPVPLLARLATKVHTHSDGGRAWP